jgi:hypothetical protein
MKKFKNPYALLNYDMDAMKSTPEFEKATGFIDGVIEEMVAKIKSEPFQIEPSQVGYCFYGNLHWGSIGENRVTGDSRIDGIIAEAVEKLVEFSNGPEDDGGIGDTHTDECIAYEVDRLMQSESVTHSTLMNRA